MNSAIMKKALERISRYPWDDPHSDDAQIVKELACAALSQPPATEQIRREVIEECAKVADTEAAKLIATGNALLASAVATTAQFSEAELHDQAGTAIQKIAADLRALAATEQPRSQEDTGQEIKP